MVRGYTYHCDRCPASINLAPRSLVDEPEGEIWQSKKDWLLHLTPVQSPLKIYAVFRGKLSSNSSSNLEVPAVGEIEKTRGGKIWIEVICHSGLNNF